MCFLKAFFLCHHVSHIDFLQPTNKQIHQSLGKLFTSLQFSDKFSGFFPPFQGTIRTDTKNKPNINKKASFGRCRAKPGLNILMQSGIWAFLVSPVESHLNNLGLSFPANIMDFSGRTSFSLSADAPGKEDKEMSPASRRDPPPWCWPPTAVGRPTTVRVRDREGEEERAETKRWTKDGRMRFQAAVSSSGHWWPVLRLTCKGASAQCSAGPRLSLFQLQVFFLGTFGVQNKPKLGKTGNNRTARNLRWKLPEFEVTKTDRLARWWELEVKRSRGWPEVGPGRFDCD